VPLPMGVATFEVDDIYNLRTRSHITNRHTATRRVAFLSPELIRQNMEEVAQQVRPRFDLGLLGDNELALHPGVDYAHEVNDSPGGSGDLQVQGLTGENDCLVSCGGSLDIKWG